MKSNAQLRRDDSNDEVPPPAAMPVSFPDMASSSHTVPPSEQLAGVYVLHAAVYEFHAVSCALHRQGRGAEPAGPSGVPEVSSS
jgi:hypothetical protein